MKCCLCTLTEGIKTNKLSVLRTMINDLYNEIDNYEKYLTSYCEFCTCMCVAFKDIKIIDVLNMLIEWVGRGGEPKHQS